MDENMFDLFDILKDISKEIDINFVIKEHPSDRISIYDKLYQRLEIRLYSHLKYTNSNSKCKSCGYNQLYCSN